MHIIIETAKLNNVIKELTKLYIKGKTDLNTIENCVLIQSDIFGRVSFTAHINGLARTSITLEDVQVINPGECLVNLFLLSKKTKYIDESFLELEYQLLNNNEYLVYIRTENINGKLTSPIFQLNEFTQFDLVETAVCDLSPSALNNWIKTVRNFCTGLETLSIRVQDGYLESCTFNSISHQTMLLYTRLATNNDYVNNFVINLPAVVLNTMPNFPNEVNSIRIGHCCSQASQNDEQVLKLTQDNTTWCVWTNLQPKVDQLSVAEYCNSQPPYSKLILDKGTLINRLEYLIHQPQNSSNKFLVSLDLRGNKSNNIQLELSIGGIEDTATVLVKQYEGTWYKQKYDAQKLMSALRVLSVNDIVLEQFITDTENTDNLDEALSLRISDLQEQSRVEIYIESAY
jgi:hypothetical protein